MTGAVTFLPRLVTGFGSILIILLCGAAGRALMNMVPAGKLAGIRGPPGWNDSPYNKQVLLRSGEGLRLQLGNSLSGRC